MTSTGYGETQGAKIGCIGGGNMARALIGGWLKSGVLASDLAVAEPNSALREALAGDFSVFTTESNTDLGARANVWLLAVKPQVMRAVCEPLREVAEQVKPLVISIAAGITTANIQSWLGKQARVVRAMPNTPALFNVGITGLFAGQDIAHRERELAHSLMQAVGPVTWVETEAMMDTVTATSGSGPAYFFLLMESMQRAAVAQGLTPEVAKALVLQTAVGAAHMALNADVPVAQLRESVTSPGGTTQAALEVFAAGQFDALVASAMQAAQLRGSAMAKQFGETSC